MTKSFVTLEQHRCIICGADYDTGSLLLDKRLSNKFEHHTLTGMGMCPADKQKFDEGYLALVESDPARTKVTNGVIKPGDEYRTGVIVHIRRTVAREIFNVAIPDNLPMMFIDPEVTATLQAMMPKEEEPT